MTAIFTGCGTGSNRSATTTTHPTVAVGEHSNGKTITLHPRQHLVVTLHSTYWQLASPSTNALLVTSAPTTASGGPGCSSIPGTGCGTVIAEYAANHAGTADLSAHRDSCGEALRCSGTAGDWRVTVVVTP